MNTACKCFISFVFLTMTNILINIYWIWISNKKIRMATTLSLESSNYYWASQTRLTSINEFCTVMMYVELYFTGFKVSVHSEGNDALPLVGIPSLGGAHCCLGQICLDSSLPRGLPCIEPVWDYHTVLWTFEDFSRIELV